MDEMIESEAHYSPTSEDFMRRPAMGLQQVSLH